MLYLALGIYLLFAVISDAKGKNFKKNSFLVFLFLALNNFNGFDWISYYEIYQELQLTNLFGISNLFESGSPGFLIVLLIAKWSGTYNTVFVISAAFFSYSTVRFAKSYANKNLILFLLFCFLGYYYYVERIKQGFALSFIILALSFLQKGEKKKAALGIALAISFHASALLALPLLFFPAKHSIASRYHRAVGTAIVLVFSLSIYFIVRSSLLDLLPGLLGYYTKSYTDQILDTFNLAFFWSLGGLSFVILILVLLNISSVKPKTTRKNYAFFSYLFAYTTNIYYGFPRLSAYYYPYVISTLAEFYEGGRARRKIRIIILICGFVQLARPLMVPYYFESIMRYEVWGISSKGPAEMKNIRCDSILSNDAGNELALYSCAKNIQ